MYYHTDGDNSAVNRPANGFQVSYESFGELLLLPPRPYLSTFLGQARMPPSILTLNEVINKCIVGYFYSNTPSPYFCQFLFLDIDECYTASCSQECRNYPGSYSCSCRDGWFLSADGVTCFGMIATAFS